MRVAQFTSKEDVAQRQNRKNSFYNGDIQALIAIKCLDEGVNIPKIKTAFILASTTNPKEYIQRRGRVLRLSKGKEYAKIYDFVTLPRPLEDVPHLTLAEMKKDRTLVVNELKRIIEFKNLARNPYDSDSIVDSIVETYELYKDEEFVGICEEFGGEKDG
jgi:superfamily II DNA or RNA helicase